MTTRRLFLTALITLTAAASAPAVAAAAPVWQTPLVLSNPGPDIARPAIVAAPDGSVTVVWEQSNGTDVQVAAKSRSAQGVWSDPVFVSNTTGGIGAYSVKAVAADDGSVTVIWMNSGYSAVAVSVKQAGSDTWSTESDAGVEAGEYFTGGALAAGPDDSTVLLTTGGVSGDNKLRLRRRAAGSDTFTVIGEIDQPDGYGQSSPSVAYNENGDAVAAWVAQTTDPQEVRASHYTAGTGSWSMPVTIGTESAGVGGVGEVHAAINDEGAGVALWTTAYASNISAAPVDTDGQTTAPSSLLVTGPMAVLPRIAADDDGQFVAAWQEFDYTDMVNTAYALSKTYSVSGDSWSSVEIIGGLHGGAPDLAANADGDMVVGMMTGSSLDTAHFAVAYRATGSSSFETPVAAGSPNVYAGAEGTPVVALDDLGNASVAYPQQDGSSIVTGFAGGDGDGPSLGASSVPSSGTVGVPVSFSTASPFDLWSDIASTGWEFGDGGSAAGTSVSHTYSAPGTYAVELSATDSSGFSTTSAAGTITIAPAPLPPAVDDDYDGGTEDDYVAPPKKRIAAPIIEARLSGRTITLNAKVKLSKGSRCSGKVTAKTKYGTRTYRTTLKLKTTGKTCRATGKIKLKKTPSTRTKLRVKISGKNLRSRTITTKRA